MAIAPTDLEIMAGEPASLEEPAREPIQIRSSQTRIVGILFNFCIGQGSIQAIGVLGGLLLVRRLSVEAYSQFGLATAFQSVASALMDLGFAATIVPLVGSRRDDLALVGRYVRAAKHLRDRSFLIIAPVASIIFLVIMHQHHWPWGTQVMLLASVLLALYTAGKAAYFSAPLLLQGKIREYYAPQAISGVGKLAAYVTLAFTGGLNAWTAAGLGALNIAANGELIQRKSGPFMKWPAQDSKETDKEVLHYVLPSAPATIFAAFQSQLTVLMIGLFGGTAELAQVAALGKIAQLFSVMMIFNAIVIEPYMARVSRARLLRNYLGFLAIATAMCVPLVILGFWHPETYLWILGSKYSVLRDDIGWLILGNSISFLAGLIWIMNRSRKWLFWSGSALEIVLLLGAQAAFLAFVGVRTVRQAVLFTFASSFCYLIAHSYVSIFGFLKGASTDSHHTAGTHA